MSERNCQPNSHDPPYQQAAIQNNRMHWLITIVKHCLIIFLYSATELYTYKPRGYEANSVACEHATFPNWKINTSHHFSLFAWAEIMSFSAWRQMGVELLRYHTYTVSLSYLFTAGHTTLVHSYCVWGGKSNILLSCSLWQSWQLWAKLRCNEVKSWRREIQWTTSRAAAICLQGNHCIIILKDKAHTRLHNSMCMSQSSILILKWEGKYLKIS